MPTRTLLRTDIESILRVAADSIGELLAVSPTTTATASMSPAQTSMAAVIHGDTIVFGLAIDDASLQSLTRVLLPDLEAEPNDAEVESTRLTVSTQVFAAIEEAIGQPLIEVDPESFYDAFRVDLGDSTIEIGVTSIPVGAPASAPPAGRSWSSMGDSASASPHSSDRSHTGSIPYLFIPAADRIAMDRLSVTSPAFDTPRLIASITLGLGGLVLAAMWMVLSIDRAFLIGLSLGLAAALAIQWAQILWFTANVKRTEHLEWIKRLPPSLAAFRRPLRAMLLEMDEREAAIAEAISREQMRSVEAETLRSKVQTLETALSETRSDMMDVLDGLKTLEGSYQDATIGRIARLASLRSSLQGPVVVKHLAELVAEIAAARISIRNRVVLSGPLPAVTCPTQVIETLLDELLAELGELSDGPIEVAGQSDGGMAVLTFGAGQMSAAVSPDVSVAQRAARLLGGDVWISADRSVVVAVPRRYEPGMESLRPSADAWDISELF